MPSSRGSFGKSAAPVAKADQEKVKANSRQRENSPQSPPEKTGDVSPKLENPKAGRNSATDGFALSEEDAKAIGEQIFLNEGSGKR